jgi:hypothetical protein
MRALLCFLGFHSWTPFVETDRDRDGLVYSRACRFCPQAEEYQDPFFIEPAVPQARCDECGQPMDSILCCQNQHA